MAEVEETYVGGEEEYAEFWKPNPGDMITGRIVRVHTMQGDYGLTPVVTVENSDGQLAILIRGKVFREEMAERRPKIGDELSVTYLGTKKPKSGVGLPYHVYRVQGGTEKEFDWDQFVDPAPVSAEIPIQREPVPQASTPVSQAPPAAQPVPAHVPGADYDPNGPLPFAWVPGSWDVKETTWNPFM